MIKVNSILQFGQQILATILLLYHLLIWAVEEPLLRFGLSFVLYGLFLLWQPLWSKEARVKKLPVAVIAILFFLITYFFPPRPPEFAGRHAAALARYLPEHSWDPVVLTAALPADPLTR